VVDEKDTRFKFIHALLKGGFRNIINITYNGIPTKYLVDDVSKISHSPELINLWNSYELAIEEFCKYNSATFIEDNSTGFAMLEKMKHIVFTLLLTDTAYQAMMEYFLKHYVHIKFDHAFKPGDIDKAFDEQWKKVLEEIENR